MRIVGRLGGALAAMAVALLAPGHALGASGQLDRSFGGDGRATAFFRGWKIGDQIADIAMAPGGKTLVASEMFHPKGRFKLDPGIARFDRHGEPDRSFSRNGQEILDTPGFEDGEVNVAAQSDGKVLVMSDEGRGAPAVFRLLANGRLDRSFGIDGRMGLSFTTVADLHVLPDDRIVVTGSQHSSADVYGPYDFRVEVLKGSGRVDHGFGPFGSGSVDVDFSDPAAGGAHSSDYLDSSTVMRDGRIVLVGSSTTPSPYSTERIAVARLSPNGQLDATLDSDGRYVASAASGGAPTREASGGSAAVATTSDGGLVFGGADGNDFLATRLTADGTPNTLFGTDGVSVVHAGKGQDDADALAFDRRGSIYFAGSVGDRRLRDFAVMKVTGGGEPDRVFGGGDGLVTIDFEGKYDDADGVTVLPNRKILASGTIGDYRIGLIRLLP